MTPAAPPSNPGPIALSPMLRGAVAEIAMRYGVRSFALFGSAARGDVGPNSDIDVVMELDPNSAVGLFEHARIADELGRLLGRPVDLVTWNSLRPRFRSNVERDTVTIFAR